MSLVDSLAQGIARFEGFYTAGSLAQRNHNPGNLRSWGTNPVSGGYAVFPDDAAGWDALKRQIQININRGLNLYEFFAGKGGVYSGYAPSTDNNQPIHYAQTVAGWVGLDPTVKLSSYQSGDVGIGTQASGGVSPPLDKPPGEC
jgi:hypothetical protein